MISYVWGIVAHFDFGPSFIYKDRTVNEIIAQGFPVTLTYGSISFVVAVLVGVSAGRAGGDLAQHLAGLSGGGHFHRRAGAAELRDGADPGAGLHAVAGLAARRRLGGRAVAICDHAGHRAGHLLHGLDRADHPVVDAGGADLEPHPHRAGQGPADATR